MAAVLAAWVEGRTARVAAERAAVGSAAVGWARAAVGLLATVA